MTVEKPAYLDTFKEKLLLVYQQVAVQGDAPAYDKGIVQGIMITGRAMNIVTKEELQHVIDQERLRVFGTTERPSIKRGKQSVEHTKGMLDEESYLDIPTFLRVKRGQ